MNAVKYRSRDIQNIIPLIEKDTTTITVRGVTFNIKQLAFDVLFVCEDNDDSYTRIKTALRDLYLAGIGRRYLTGVIAQLAHDRKYSQKQIESILDYVLGV